MRMISLAEYLATKIEEDDSYTTEDLAEEILDSINLKTGNDEVLLSLSEYELLNKTIVEFLEKKVEEEAKELIDEWDGEASDDLEERKRGLGGRY